MITAVVFRILAQIGADPGALNLPNKGGVPDNAVQNILQIVFGFAGAIAFLIIVIAGLRFVLSEGDPQKTAQARNTIIYALIGLVIAIFGFSIVTFVVGRV